jgi:PAS domain S-box-containing protein
MDTRTFNIDLQSLVDTHEHPFVIIDRKFTIVAVNKAYENTYGGSREEMIGKSCYQVSHHNDKPCYETGEDCPYQNVYASGEGCSCLHIHYDDDGDMHKVRIKAFPLYDGDGELYLGEAIEELSRQDPKEISKLRMAGRSPEFMRLLEQLKLAAATDAPVLLEGETGTGKDLAANFIHLHSRRCDKPFLTLDCTVLTESLFEAEVFGHAKGAFTGSVGEKEGLFQLVDGGTLFLDEIGEMPAHLQAKLLRVLETGEYRRVGGRITRRTNARIICATNRNLGSDIANKSFREDLYYRVACLHIQVPGLRERLQDIPALAEALLDRISESSGRPVWLGPGCMAELQAYHYPGNIRELRNILSVAAAQSATNEIDADTVAAVVRCMQSRREADCGSRAADVADNVRQKTGRTLDDLEAEHINRLLRQRGGNRRQVAADLGVSERTLYRKLKRYQLS